MKNISKITLLISSLIVSSASLAIQAPSSVYNTYLGASPSFLNADNGFVVMSGASVRESSPTSFEPSAHSDAPIEASSASPSISIGEFSITLPSESGGSSSIFGVAASGSNLPPYAVYNLSTSSIGIMTNRISLTVSSADLSKITSKYPLELSFYSEALNTAFFSTTSDPLEFINALKAETSVSDVNMEIIEYMNEIN